MKSLSRKFVSAVVGLCLTAGYAPAEEPAQFKTGPAEHPVTINPMLLGTQFNFFSPPVQAKLNDAALQESWRSAPIRTLRYPGGTWADHYVWDNPSMSWFAAGDAKHIVTPEQFVKLCREVGAEPIFQVNVSSKGHDIQNRLNPTKPEDIETAAQWAAGWVRQANVENGWKVKYWEIGNEVWIWLKPEENARIVAAYSKAMKAVDPSIKIIACGLSSKVGPFDSSWLNIKGDPTWEPRKVVINEPEAWNQALATIAAGTFDYVAPHPYMSAKNEVPDDKAYLTTAIQVEASTALRDQQRLARASNGMFRLAVTEWTCNFGRSVPVKRDYKPTLYYYSLGNGLNVAQYFGRILEGADVTDIAVHHSIEDSQTLYYWPKKELASGPPLEHPTALAMRLWGSHLGTSLDKIETAGVPTLDVDGQSLPLLQAWASSSESAAYLVVLNLDPEKPHTFTWKGPATANAPAEAQWMTGASLKSENFSAWDDPLKAGVKLTTETLPAAASPLTVTMPAHSMLGLKIPLNSKPAAAVIRN